MDVICVARDYAEGITFDSSNHWKPADGLNCARIILHKMYNDYNFDLDYHVLDKENFYDLTSKYPQIKSIIEDRFGYCFSVLSPINSPCIELIYAEGEPIIGSYESVIFNPIESWNMDGGAYHNVYTISNFLINSIHNDEAFCNKKVLIIGDSFNWPVGSYLSLACEDVTIIHNASFIGSLISYIKKMNPDMVIMVYNDAEFYETYKEDAYFLK